MQDVERAIASQAGSQADRQVAGNHPGSEGRGAGFGEMCCGVLLHASSRPARTSASSWPAPARLAPLYCSHPAPPARVRARSRFGGAAPPAPISSKPLAARGAS